jgi:hypothetical protein
MARSHVLKIAHSHFLPAGKKEEGIYLNAFLRDVSEDSVPSL